MKAMLRVVASLKLTLVLLLTLVAAVINAYQSSDELFRASQYGMWLTLPLAALTLNLAAAIATSARFRAQPPLLVFHLSLLAIVLLAGLGQLSNLKARTEVSVGNWYTGELDGIQAGPLHGDDYTAVRFMNAGFTIDYAPGPVRRHTRNRILTNTGSGLEEQFVGDQVPLIVDGYRFYTSFNKGFAPKFVWRNREGQVSIGTVHLPAWPLHQFEQAVEWQLPDSERTIWIQLEFDEEILSKLAPSQFRAPNEYRLVVRDSDRRTVLQAGESIRFEEGELAFDGLTTWMGYSVFYDQSRYWMLSACLVAILSISWHYWQTFNRQPWRPS